MPSLRSPFAAVLATSIALLPIAAASAQEWHHHSERFAIMRQLDLTSQQKTQIHDIIHSNRMATASTRLSLQAVDSQIRSSKFSDGNVSASQLTALMQQREALRAQLDQSRVSTIIAVRGVLTPSQLSTASSLETKLASLHQQERALLHPASDVAAPTTTPAP